MDLPSLMIYRMLCIRKVVTVIDWGTVLIFAGLQDLDL
jgi:hypothetical protein